MKNMRIVALTMVASLALSACATTGEQNDALSRQLPDVDQQVRLDGSPVDPSRLIQDEVDCVHNVRANPSTQMANGAVGGALLGVALGAMLGGGGRYTGRLMAQGAFTGAVGGATAGAINGEIHHNIGLANCLAGRGYRVLD